METGKEVVKISLSNIIPNRFQPRISFDEQALNELANSIKMYGILQPLILRPLGDKYEIIAGERRYKAATLAGLTEVPAILVNLDDQTSAELAIIENIQRKDLTAIEEAKSYKKLLDLGNYTQEQLAVKMGKNQSTIANKLRLLNLVPEAQEALMNNLISERHARSLLQLKDDQIKQKEVLNKIITERLTVKDTDELIKNMMGGTEMNQTIQNFNIPNEIPNSNTPNVTPSLNTFNFNTPNLTPDLNNQNTNLYDFNTINLNTTAEPINTETPSINNEFINQNIPNMNNDMFNLAQLSNADMQIPSTPLVSETPAFDLNTMLNTQPVQEEITQPAPVEEQISNQIPDFNSLLKVEEKAEEPKIEEPQIPQVKIETPPPINKYFPSLEDTPVNMTFGQNLNIPAPTPLMEEPQPQVTAPTTNISMAINSTRDMIKNLEGNGYKITTEEVDLPDVYQITIKINKNNNNESFPQF